MIDVLLVDDEPAGRRILREYCEAESDLRVVGEYGDGAAALDAIRVSKPQLLFLDIQMSPLNGLEVARALDGDPNPSIVFVTAYDRYALDAFEVCAIDYLVKPFDQDRFRRTLTRVRSRRPAAVDDGGRAALADLVARLTSSVGAATEDKGRLLAESGGRLHVIEAGRVEMIEADRNYVAICVGRERYYMRSTLYQAEQAMSLQPMLRISRSCLVNTNHVREVTRTFRGDFILILSGGATVTSSEGFRNKVKDYLNSMKIASS